MELDDFGICRPLSSTEKESQMREGHCLYCGKLGHTTVVCPSLARRNSRFASQPLKKQVAWAFDAAGLSHSLQAISRFEPNHGDTFMVPITIYLSLQMVETFA